MLAPLFTKARRKIGSYFLTTELFFECTVPQCTAQSKKAIWQAICFIFTGDESAEVQIWHPSAGEAKFKEIKKSEVK